MLIVYDGEVAADLVVSNGRPEWARAYNITCLHFLVTVLMCVFIVLSHLLLKYGVDYLG